MVKKKVRSSKTKELGLFEKFTLKFFDHLKISIFFWISIFLFGLFSYTTFLQREGFPQVSVPISVVRAVYLANDKNSVDTLVTKPILESLDSNDTIEQTTANTTNNASVIVIQHKDDYSSEEGSKSAQDSINKIKDTLPENVDITYESVNATKFNNKYDILISVSSPSRDSEEISKTAEEVASKLLEKPEIVDTQIEELFTEGFNPITNQQEKIQTSFDWSGQRIDNSFSISPSVVIGINLEPGTDIVKFEPELNNLLSEIQNQYKDTDIKISKAAGFAENIKEQTDSLQQNLFEGLIIVVLICF
ncbi:efflux RND transporter permease subunit, partial [Candidatus Saccharibacteria bacterium]|nr:efflux RND transporter permease subunit [Candidatus Saccharibacteria bacterium]